jgi:hypothetical protein
VIPPDSQIFYSQTSIFESIDRLSQLLTIDQVCCMSNRHVLSLYRCSPWAQITIIYDPEHLCASYYIYILAVYLPPTFTRFTFNYSAYKINAHDSFVFTTQRFNIPNALYNNKHTSFLMNFRRPSNNNISTFLDGIYRYINHQRY